MALTADRNTPLIGHNIALDRVFPVKSGKTIYAGGLVVLSGGYAQPATTATGLTCVGRAEEYVDNSDGADGVVNVRVRKGIFRYENSADADELTQADIGKDCYIVDDATVAKTDGGGTRSVAGKVFDVDDDGVWVEITK